MTQAYAIVGPDGLVITDTVSEDPDLLEWQGKPIIPVTIIPDADKVQWAAWVLLDAGLTRHHWIDEEEAGSDLDYVGMTQRDDGEWVSIAAIRALAAMIAKGEG